MNNNLLLTERNIIIDDFFSRYYKTNNEFAQYIDEYPGTITMIYDIANTTSYILEQLKYMNNPDKYPRVLVNRFKKLIETVELLEEIRQEVNFDLSVPPGKENSVYERDSEKYLTTIKTIEALTFDYYKLIQKEKVNLKTKDNKKTLKSLEGKNYSLESHYDIKNVESRHSKFKAKYKPPTPKEVIRLARDYFYIWLKDLDLSNELTKELFEPEREWNIPKGADYIHISINGYTLQSENNKGTIYRANDNDFSSNNVE